MPSRAAAAPDAVDTSLRSPEQRSRTFAGILANPALANITTSYLWFALTFRVYLETRNVIAAGFTLVMFTLSGVMFLLTPAAWLLDLTQPWYWLFALVILIGAPWCSRRWHSPT